MMIRKVATLFVLVAAIAAASTPKPATQIKSGTDVGLIGVKIAVPEFQAVSPDAKSTALTAVFNKVLWDDLDYSGGVTLVSKSYYPLGIFGGPGDVKPADWTTPAADAQFIAFVNIPT